MNVLRELVQVVGDFLARLGPLRVALVGGAVLVMMFAPPADTRTVYEGMGFVRTVVMPTLAPLFLTGLLLDALMCRVLMNDPDGAGPTRLRPAMWTELLVALVLILAYAPFFFGLAA